MSAWRPMMTGSFGLSRGKDSGCGDRTERAHHASGVYGAAHAEKLADSAPAAGFTSDADQGPAAICADPMQGVDAGAIDCDGAGFTNVGNLLRRIPTATPQPDFAFTHA